MKLKYIAHFFALPFVLICSSANAQETGDLKIRFEYGGEPVGAKPINVDKDVAFCGQHELLEERLLVNQENRGIKNFVVYVYTGRGGSKIDKVEPVGASHTLTNLNCRFEPRILLAQVGDSLTIANPDSVAHNANLNFISNKPQNLMIPAQQEKEIKLEEAEPAPIPIDCNIHPWMRARILVLDHPFAAVSDENGELTIKGLPTGKIVLRANHEAARIKTVEVDGKEETWKRSNFEVEIKPGMNDMGTVVIPAEAFN